MAKVGGVGRDASVHLRVCYAVDDAKDLPRCKCR